MIDTELAQQLQQENGGKVVIREDEQAHNDGEGQWKKCRSKQRKHNSQAKSNVCNFSCKCYTWY